MKKKFNRLYLITFWTSFNTVIIEKYYLNLKDHSF